MKAPGTRGKRGFDRQGAVLLAGSTAVLLFLYGSAFGVVAAGAARWRSLANPDPTGGAISALFFLTSTLLMIASIASTFIVFSYAGEYRGAWTERLRADAGQRWTGALFVLAGIPFFVLGFFATGALLQLLWLGALLGFGTGGGFLVAAHLRSGDVRP